MSDFKCPYCEETNDGYDLVHVFECHESENVEINCKFCKKTMAIYREFDPVYYPSKIEETLKDHARTFASITNHYKSEEEKPSWVLSRLSQIKEDIKQTGQIIKKNRQVANNAPTK